MVKKTVSEATSISGDNPPPPIAGGGTKPSLKNMIITTGGALAIALVAFTGGVALGHGQPDDRFGIAQQGFSSHQSVRGEQPRDFGHHPQDKGDQENEQRGSEE